MRREIMLVDFFDTVMYRDVHSFQLGPQWEKALKNKYGIPEWVSLRKIRGKASGGSGAKKYREVIRKVYLELRRMGFCDCTEEEFYEVSYLTETYLDFGTQYPNWKMVRYLRRQKKKGKRLYLVSDFCLPTDVYPVFLERWKLGDLFEKIYCSSDWGKTKWEGSLYDAVLRDLGVDAGKVLMIGDSRRADVVNPRKRGIKGYWYFPFFHKVKTNLSRRLDSQTKRFRRACGKRIYRRAYRHSLFSEYGAVFHFISERLYQELCKDCVKEIPFLSRGGYLMKMVFDQYQKIRIPEKAARKTCYLKNSRNANRRAMANEEERALLKEYFAPHITREDRLYLVDEGWNGHIQMELSQLLHVKTYGYYIGLFPNPLAEEVCTRKGLLFHIEKNKRSPFYGVFRTNCTFYEQICQEPSGGVERYVREKGRVTVVQAVSEREEALHKRYTDRLQTEIQRVALALTVWEAAFTRKQLALLLLRTLLFADRERSRMLQEYADSVYGLQKGQLTKAGGFQNMGVDKGLKISLKGLLFYPEEYMRYFCKIKEFMGKTLWQRILYFPIGSGIYVWCWLSIKRKRDKPE